MKQAGMVSNVLANEGGHEVIGVVVASLHPERHGHLRVLRRLHECEGLQLVHLGREEVVSRALVTQDVQVSTFVRLDQLARIVLLPSLLVVAEVQLQRLRAPRDVHWVADRRKGRYRCVPVRILQRDGQSAMAAHGVAGDRANGGHVEVGLDDVRKLLRDVTVHVEVLLVLIGRCVHVETCANTEVVDLRILVRHPLAAG
mmetsp:Transcript_158288/g.507693  ORF Transcript_158288/g.507693 Transcript_158288/m.507693 type:complete len:200 (+) Transcript_158288:90-689(+)